MRQNPALSALHRPIFDTRGERLSCERFLGAAEISILGDAKEVAVLVRTPLH
jgi:hypothetical protein